MKLSLFLSLLFVATVGYTQEAIYDSTYRPDIYSSRVELFKAFPTTAKDIVFIGNSITFWADWRMFLKTSHVKNRGIPGDISFGVLDRLDEVIKGKPVKVFIMIGINDLARNIPNDIIIQNAYRIVRAIKTGSPDTQIYLQSILPTNRSFNKLNKHYNKEMQTQVINDALRKLAKITSITYIDLYKHFIDQAGQLKKEYTWDGVHLTYAGYQKWVQVLRAKDYIH